MTEIDGKMTAVVRGGANQVTVPEADLGGYRVGGQRPVSLLKTTEAERLQPYRIDLSYSKAGTLDPGLQHDQRANEATSSRTRLNISTLEVLSDDEAKAVVTKLMDVRWYDRRIRDSTLTRKYLRHTPTDVMTLAKGAKLLRSRVKQIHYAEGGLLRFKWRKDVASAYGQNATGAPIAFDPGQLKSLTPSVMFLLDAPMLRDADDAKGPYTSADGLAVVTIRIAEPGNNAGHKPVTFHSSGLREDANYATGWGGGVLDVNTDPIRGLQVLQGSGTITASITITGLRKSLTANGTSGKRLIREVVLGGSTNSVDFLNDFAGQDFDKFELEALGVTGASDLELHLRVAEDGSTPESDAADYRWLNQWRVAATTEQHDGDTSDDSIQISAHIDGGAATSFYNGEIIAYLPSSTVLHKDFRIRANHTNDDATSITDVLGSGTYIGSTNAITGIQIIGRNTSDDGDVNIAGTFRLWGLPKA